jgi:hypothetical protein
MVLELNWQTDRVRMDYQWREPAPIGDLDARACLRWQLERLEEGWSSNWLLTNSCHKFGRGIKKAGASARDAKL